MPLFSQRLLPLLGLLLLLATAARADETPLLQVDSGGHQALIRSVVFTPDGRYLVSASDDKTIRVWDWKAGKTIKVLRGQTGPGDEGKLFAMALSPDGRWLAAAGYMKNGGGSQYGDIRLYDFERGELVGLLRGHTNPVSSLAFSPDSRRLASGSADDTAIVWDVAQRHLLHRLKGHSNAIYGISFSRDNHRLVTASDDKMLKLWNAEAGTLIATMSQHSDDVNAVVYSPTEDLIASGSWDHRILLWDGKTGRFLRQLADQQTHVGSLSFSPDGQILLSGVGAGPNKYCHVYAVATGKEITTYQGHDNIVLASTISPDGAWAATGGGDNNEIHVWDLHTGKLEQRLTGTGASVQAVGFSSDGQRLLSGKTFNYTDTNHRGPLEYQLRLPTADEGLGVSQAKTEGAVVQAEAQHGAWSLTTHVGGDYGYPAILDISNNSKTQASIERGATDGYRHRAYGFSPDGKTVFSGGDSGFLSAYDLQGHKLGDFIGHTSEVWALAVSPDGRYLASGSNDQTVRLWDIKTRENLLTLFQGQDGEWVAWTASGYYAASPGGGKLIGWQVNRGADKNADFYPAEQFRQSKGRPDVVAETLRRGSESAALAALKNQRPVIDPASLIAAKPATPRLLKPLPAQVDTPEQVLTLAVDASAKNLLVTVNGKPTRGLKRIEERETSEAISLSTGDNQIVVVASNSIGQSDPLQLSVFLKAKEQDWKKPALYVLAIGVSDYADKGFKLNFADQDADALAERLKREQGGLYREVQVKTLTNAGATRSAILKAFAFVKQMSQDDLAIVFLAGHGKQDAQGEFYFLPHDVDDAELLVSAVKWTDFKSLAQGLPGKVMLMADACHSAALDGKQLRRDLIDTNELIKEFTNADVGAVMLTSSMGKEFSEESPAWRHGAFTKAVLDGFNGGADYDHDGVVHVSELELYVKRAVPELTAGRQHPIGYSRLADFALVKVR